MKLLFLSVCLSAIFSCNTPGNNTQSVTDSAVVNEDSVANVLARQSSPEGKWNLIPVMASDTATGRTPFISFNTQEKKISGNTGCNSFGGSFMADSTGMLSFGRDIMSTKMACPGYNENIFVQNLQRVNRYSISGDTLALKENETPVSYWMRSR
jgi:heat shock protein HslJ